MQIILYISASYTTSTLSTTATFGLQIVEVLQVVKNWNFFSKYFPVAYFVHVHQGLSYRPENCQVL